jgi:hypothetical protein
VDRNGRAPLREGSVGFSVEERGSELMSNEKRMIGVQREIEERAEAYGIKGADDEDNEYAIDQFKCWLVEHPRILDAAFAMLEHNAKPGCSLFDSPLFSGKRIGDALRPEIRKSAGIMMALGRAMLVRANSEAERAATGRVVERGEV